MSGRCPPKQLAGFRNNVKGIYHELKYVGRESADGDDVDAETYELTNHPGADVRLVNRTTGETTDIQLKATDSAAYVAAHGERFPGIEVLTTEETSARDDRRPVVGVRQRRAGSGRGRGHGPGWAARRSRWARPPARAGCSLRR